MGCHLWSCTELDTKRLSDLAAAAEAEQRSPGNFLEMQMLRPPTKHSEAEMLLWGPTICFNLLARRSCCVLKVDAPKLQVLLLLSH